MCLERNTNIERTKSKAAHITEEERYKIEGYKEIGMSSRQIGKAIGKTHGAVNKEIKRGTVKRRTSELIEIEVYKADYARMKADKAKENHGGGLKIGKAHELAAFLEKKIGGEGFSPDAALAEARKLEISETTICTKTLYNYIDRDLFLNISNKNLLYKKRGKGRGYNKVHKAALNNKKGKSIEERPESINNREGTGHWEIDLVIGKKGRKPVILTLIERKSRKSIYMLLKNKTQEEAVRALKRIASRTRGDFSEVFKTITADNGSEFSDFESMKEAANCGEIYYAHPYSSWE
jgi:IS30 family transposase